MDFLKKIGSFITWSWFITRVLLLVFVGIGLCVAGVGDLRLSSGEPQVLQLEALEKGEKTDASKVLVKGSISRFDLFAVTLSHDEKRSPDAVVQNTFYPIVSKGHALGNLTDYKKGQDEGTDIPSFSVLVKTGDNYQIKDVPTHPRPVKQIKGMLIGTASSLGDKEVAAIKDRFGGIDLNTVQVLEKDGEPSIVMGLVFIVGGGLLIILGIGLFVFQIKGRDDTQSAFSYCDGKDWIISAERQPATTCPDLKKSLLVHAVEEGTPAAKLPIAPGDLLISVDGYDLFDLDLLEQIENEESVQYVFYLTQAKALLEVEAKAVPLGIGLEPTDEAIVELCKTDNYDYIDLIILWRREHYDALLQACRLILELDDGKPLGPQRLAQYSDDDAALFIGIVLWEQGQKDSGYTIINDYVHEMDDQGADLKCIAYFYAAQTNQAKGDSDLFLEFAQQTAEFSRGLYPVIEQWLAANQIEKPSPSGDASLPLSHEMKYLENLKQPYTLSLTKTLDKMTSGQLLPVCLMPAYRVNHLYDEAMAAYRLLYPYLHKYLKPLHVITDTLEFSRDVRDYAENEKLCKKMNVPVVLLHDPENVFAEHLNLSITPTFCFLDNSGNVVYQGDAKQSAVYWTSFYQIGNDLSQSLSAGC